jgi:pyrroloquinoline quinone biosynthesis protein B
MRVAILGSAAGGGFPQWNCNCQNCISSRDGTLNGKARTQAQVAICQDFRAWFLLNASPDLRTQIESTPVLHPHNHGRNSPISGVLLTSADIDQVAGLLSLRELQPFRIYCTPSIRRILQEDNSMFAMLNRVPDQVSWTDISCDGSFCLQGERGARINCEVVSLGNRFPAYVSPDRALELNPAEASLGVIAESASGKRLAYLPAVPEIDDALLKRLDETDILLFDGTFWSDEELLRMKVGSSLAREMGHIPVSGTDGSLRKLAGLQRPRKIFIHVNNTNPMLDESGPEYAEVWAAGWEVAEDGLSFEL